MSSPFRNYDAWLTTDRAAEAAEAAAEAIMDAWVEYAEANHVPLDAQDEAHSEHAIYVLWEHLFSAVDAYQNRLLAEQEAADYEAAEKAQAEWEAAQAERPVGCISVSHNRISCAEAFAHEEIGPDDWCLPCQAPV